jgi:DNA-binding HxlR family transcriptional regulator
VREQSQFRWSPAATVEPWIEEHWLELLKCKWTLQILALLQTGPRRTAELLRALPGLTAKVLHARLEELQRSGLVRRWERGGYPRHVEYRLTPEGRRVSPLIDRLLRNGVPLETAAVVLHCKWMRRLLGLLLERPHRTSELKRALPGISSKVLSERLRRLEMLGLITRTVSAERPLRVIYSATERARPLAEHADGDKKTGSPVTVMVSSAPQNCSRSKGS